MPLRSALHCSQCMLTCNDRVRNKLRIGCAWMQQYSRSRLHIDADAAYVRNQHLRRQQLARALAIYFLCSVEYDMCISITIYWCRVRAGPISFERFVGILSNNVL